MTELKEYLAQSRSLLSEEDYEIILQAILDREIIELCEIDHYINNVI